MALPNSNISVSMVKQAIGSGSNDLETLCTHEKINKWSKWKPVRFNKVSGLTEGDIQTSKCGLDRNPQTQTISYLRPRGGTYNEFYRLGDFRNYNHLAVPPVDVEIISVTQLYNNPIPGPPYTLVVGFQYEIKFKLRPGDIDPLWLSPLTSRVKNTDPLGGYGGITWVIGAEISGYKRNPNEVFSCLYLNPDTESQIITVVGTGAGLRLEYCRYEGDANNRYETINYYIEDDGISNSYRSLFTRRNLDASLRQDYDFNLWFNSIDNQLYVRIGLYNNESFPINSKIRMNYKRVETGDEFTYNGSNFELTGGYNGWQAVGPLDGWSNGTNSYEVRAWLYLVRPDATEVEIGYLMQTTAPINIEGGA